MLDWMEGRWHVLSGAPAKALPFYETAADGALYRAGSDQFMILQEALIITAFLKKRAAFKRFRHRAFAMSKLKGTITELPWEPAFAMDSEIEAFSAMFSKKFPRETWFEGQ